MKLVVLKRNVEQFQVFDQKLERDEASELYDQIRMIRATSEGGSKNIGQLAKAVGLVGEKGYANAEAQNEVHRSLDRIRGKK